MSGVWKVLRDGQVQHGLTIRAVDELVRSRSLNAWDLVCCEEEWFRVDQLSFLKRHFRKHGEGTNAPERLQPPPSEASSLENSEAAWKVIAAALALHSAPLWGSSRWWGPVLIVTIGLAGTLMLAMLRLSVIP